MTDVDMDVAAVARISAVPAILRVIGHMTGLRLALIARVTDDTWKACAVLDRMDFGLEPGGTLDIATTLCSQVRDTKEPVIIDCASEDPTYCGHPTPKMYGFESYVSVPIFMKNGDYFGNVCALDSRPARLKQGETLTMMQLFAELVGLQLEAEEQHQSTQVALLDAHETAELREQFIALLGHDIRSPLSAIISGSGLLLGRGLAAAEHKIVERLRGSAGRIARLVDDVLDFARGRLGGGIPLAMAEVHDLDQVFRQITDEARASHPQRTIHFRSNTARTLRCDRDRLAQVLSNLLSNALEHSPKDSAVDVALTFRESGLALCVTNQGEPIPEEIMTRLFQPFSRGLGARPRAGLGLGLYIVAEVVKSHEGTIEVCSSRTEGTTFVCTLPAR